MPFQQFVNTQPAPAVAGDFASRNPRHMVLAGPGGLIAGAQGVNVAAFAWLSASLIDTDNAPMVVNNFGAGPVAGFVHREQQALNGAYLQVFGNNIPMGFPVTLMSSADLWVLNSGTTECLVGMSAYAAYLNGSVSFAAINTPGTFTATGSIAAASPAVSFTGAISGDVMTVSAVATGAIAVGGTVTGTNVPSGNVVLAQLTGTAGGIGTYAMSVPEELISSEGLAQTYGVMTITVAGSGVLSVGDALSGSGVTAGTTITALGTGTGGLGTYIVSSPTVVASTTITAGASVQTKWIAMSAGAPGELVKISNQPLG